MDVVSTLKRLGIQLETRECKTKTGERMEVSNTNELRSAVDSNTRAAKDMKVMYGRRQYTEVDGNLSEERW